jgi:signal transduction histidine kinase
MTDEGWDAEDEAVAGRLVPLYVLVGGRTRPRNLRLDLATQVLAIRSSSKLEREYADIVRLCANAMSIAEVSAYLRVPLTIVRVMVDVLLEQGYLEAEVPVQQPNTDRQLLEMVLAGLERL